MQKNIFMRPKNKEIQLLFRKIFVDFGSIYKNWFARPVNQRIIGSDKKIFCIDPRRNFVAGCEGTKEVKYNEV